MIFYHIILYYETVLLQSVLMTVVLIYRDTTFEISSCSIREFLMIIISSATLGERFRMRLTSTIKLGAPRHHFSSISWSLEVKLRSRSTSGSAHEQLNTLQDRSKILLERDSFQWYCLQDSKGQPRPRDGAGALSGSLSARGHAFGKLWEPSLTVQLPVGGLRAQEAAFLIFLIFWQIKKINKKD